MKVFIVDTFTSKPFEGNPTGVCIIEEIPDASVMRSIAAELNFPVTAFVYRVNAFEENYNIRYFTSLMEIPACGHATLAAARIVFEENSINSCRFLTRNEVIIDAVGDGGSILMHYPGYVTSEAQPSKLMMESLGISEYVNAAYSEDLETLFVELESPELLKSLSPDYGKMVRSSDQVKEVVVMAQAHRDSKYDYLLRSFCPWIGIDEDPVTGSVHSVLGPYWSTRLQKASLVAFQASARGGEIIVKLMEDTVAIGGRSVIVMAGQLFPALELSRN